MLRPKDNQKVVACTASMEHFWSGNCQEIREELLRQACKSCDYYATDILILLSQESDSMEAFLEKPRTAQIDIYFKQSGCAWEVFIQGQSALHVGSVPSQYYRTAMVLTKEPHPHLEQESVFTLYRLPGNV